MHWLKWLLMAALLFTANFGLADDRQKLIGTWRLVSVETEFQATGEKELSRGKNPSGYIFFAPEGRMSALVTNEGRSPAKTDQDRAELFNTMVAYAGTYRVDGDKWITKVDAAWNPAMLGSDQTRFFRLEGNRLTEITPWGPRGDKGTGRAVLVWERTK